MQLLKERKERIERVLTGKKSDRVPFMPSFHYFPARYIGISYADYSSDYQLYSKAVLSVYRDFDFDLAGLALPGADMTLPLNFIFMESHPDLATQYLL
jgi:uroporphyrinogen-III decarboxylase